MLHLRIIKLCTLHSNVTKVYICVKPAWVYYYVYTCVHVYTALRRLSRWIFKSAATCKELCLMKKFQTSFLKASFQENPYPSRNTSRMIANQIGLSKQQVNNWFKNQRYLVRLGKGHDTIFSGKNDLTLYFQMNFIIKSGNVSNMFGQYPQI